MTENSSAWIKEFPGAITVCDRDGVVVAMNDKSAATFASSGGAALIGTNLLDCHPGASRDKLAAMLKGGVGGSYTIEKNGVKKIIHQMPWFAGGQFAGLVEISLEIPVGMPHFIRK